MKNTMMGVLSGVLLICVLVGNMLFTAYGNGVSIATMTPPQAESAQIQLPVLMYHHILKDPKRTGDYVITPDQFERDLQYIKNEGYTTVTLQEIVNYYNGQQTLPEKPILITFDDGYETVHEYAYSLLQKYNMKAAVMIIGKYTDLYSGDVVKGLSYSHVNWNQLKEMLDSGLVEVGNHTYGLHENDGGRKGIQKREGESDEQYRTLLTEDVGALNREIATELGVAPIGFAYPFGAKSKQSDDILKDLGFQIILTCEEKVNTLNTEGYQQGDLIRLNRFNRAGKYSIEELFKKMYKK